MTALIAIEPLISHALCPGLVLFERYEVGQKISDGSVASIYRALDLKTETQVAIKVFDPFRTNDPIARARFAREFETLSRLNHPRIARSLAYERSDELDVLVMEMIEGQGLDAKIARRRLSFDEARDIARSIAEALEVCHARGVIHRDLKPSNIIVHPERGPVIVDFGVASLSSAMTLTQTGAIVGSPRYLAPELIVQHHPDRRADVFSLGAILYEMVGGTPLRDVDSIAELALEQPSLEPPSVAALRPDVPPSLDDIIGRAAAFRPEDRFATAAEFAEALSGRPLDLGRPLDRNLSCVDCNTPLIVELSICPGCGARQRWDLEAGSYSVQLLELSDVRTFGAWLERRHPDRLQLSHRELRLRLRNTPTPIATNVCERSAESITRAVRASGGRAEIIKARRLLGPALTTSTASPAEILAACALHATITVGAGFIAAQAFGASITMLASIPVAVAAIGILAARWWTRRPLLTGLPEPTLHDDATLDFVAAALRNLKSPRARRLASSAVARAAPLLVDTTMRFDDTTRRLILDSLARAIAAAADVDVHRAALDAANEPDVATPTERTEIAVAYDRAAHDSLDACQRIAELVSTAAPEV